MLRRLLEKIAERKAKVQQGSSYDKRNIADDVKERSPLVKQVVRRTARIFYKQTLGDEITPLPEKYDTNQKSTLSLQEFVLSSVSENPAANLLSLEIIADSAESIEVIDNHIKVSINDGVSDHDSVKALIDGHDEVSSLITVAINAGQGATLVIAADPADFSGALV